MCVRTRVGEKSESSVRSRFWRVYSGLGRWVIRESELGEKGIFRVGRKSRVVAYTRGDSKESLNEKFLQ